jgi:hypothetical protein
MSGGVGRRIQLDWSRGGRGGAVNLSAADGQLAGGVRRNKGDVEKTCLKRTR